MTRIHKSSYLPISYASSEDDYGLLQFMDVEFLLNWGPYKQGEIVCSLAVCLGDGTVCEYDKMGEEIRITKIELTVRT
jgi:hypothetical protein